VTQWIGGASFAETNSAFPARFPPAGRSLEPQVDARTFRAVHQLKEIFDRR